MTDELEKARAVADRLRAMWPEKAVEIERAIAETQAGRRDGVSVNVGVRFRLEKFAGEIAPGKLPYDVIEGEG